MQPDKLKAARVESGLSQGALGDAIGMSRKSINEMENGKAGIEARTWAAALVAARKAKYIDRRAKAQAAVDRIDRGMTHHTDDGQGEWMDVTADYRATKLEEIAMYDELIAALDRD